MNLKTFFDKLVYVFDGNLEIEKVARRELEVQYFDCNLECNHTHLPKPIKEVMKHQNAHPICKEILKYPFNWMPPQTSNDEIYQQHSIFKSHVELLGPDGLVKSDVVRLGLYGMLPHSEYGIRTHPAEELYIMLAGDCLWKKAGGQYLSLNVNGRSYHPSNVPHASKTQRNAFMSVYVWYGELSKDDYVYKGIT